MIESRWLPLLVAGLILVAAVALRGEAAQAATLVVLAALAAVAVRTQQGQRRLAAGQRRLASRADRLEGAVTALRSEAATSAGVAAAADSVRGGVTRELRGEVAAVRDELARAGTRQLRQMGVESAQLEAAMHLLAAAPPAARMPATRGWAASPDLLLLLVELVRQRRPASIVELGSGTSTLWLGQALRRFGVPGRVVSLDHDPRWGERTSALVAAHGLTDLVEVRIAPLEPHRIDGQEWRWYAASAWASIERCDLLVVDGPPAATGPMARFPALPLLGPVLADDAVVVLDDMVREDEQRTAERWSAMLGGFGRLDVALEKQAALLFRGSPPAV